MVTESTIATTADQQLVRLGAREAGLRRDLAPSTQSLSSHALIISGIRRCGKSTLLMQMMKEMADETIFFLNFESPQLYDFAISDFSRLDQLIEKRKPTILFFDELQLVTGWEIYIRQKLDEGYRVVITGSNASLLSRELGTRLTGRHITQELFPFSYGEFLRFKTLAANAESLSAYLKTGGFPEYLKTGDEDQLATLFEDILIRDIVARYGIKDIKSLHRLATYLMSNIGNRVTATKLKQPLSIGATSTILSWFSHLELSYLVFFLPMFSHSTKAQLINPRKVYAIDTGLVDVVTHVMTDDLGRKLENLIFLHLRKKYQEIYYFADKGECDFIAMKKGAVAEIIQVCYVLNADNLDREMSGLTEAMRFFGVNKAKIVTLSDSDFFREKELEVEVIPAFRYLTE